MHFRRYCPYPYYRRYYNINPYFYRRYYYPFYNFFGSQYSNIDQSIINYDNASDPVKDKDSYELLAPDSGNVGVCTTEPVVEPVLFKSI